MFLDRKDNRKQVEMAYRQQLKQQINQRKSRVINNKNSQYRPQNEAFSLITNIQKQQNERKKKNSQYYAQLKEQIEEEKRLKSQVLAEKKRKQLEQQNKIREEQRNLKQRYEQEMLRQNKKGKSKLAAQPATIPETTPVAKSKFQNSQKEIRPLPFKPIKPNETEDTIDKMYSMQSPANNQYEFSELTVEPNLTLNSYLNKMKNESLDYVPRNLYKNNYYQQLLGQRRRLEEEAKQISELNRIFNMQRYKKKQESRGLQELKNLQKMLDDKNVNYLDLQHSLKTNQNYESGMIRSTKKQVRPIALSLRSNKDEWRKLD